HILFDIASEKLDATGLDLKIHLKDAEQFWHVINDEFYGEVDGKPFKAQIKFDHKRQRFEICSEHLDKVFMHDEPNKAFTKHLNESQNFRILFGNNMVYTQGNFFTPNLLPWRGGGERLNIENIVIGCQGLKNIASEKGNKTGWP